MMLLSVAVLWPILRRFATAIGSRALLRAYAIRPVRVKLILREFRGRHLRVLLAWSLFNQAPRLRSPLVRLSLLRYPRRAVISAREPVRLSRTDAIDRRGGSPIGVSAGWRLSVEANWTLWCDAQALP